MNQLAPFVICLVGFPGAGKLTIAQNLARSINATVVDNHWINDPMLRLVARDNLTPAPDAVWPLVAQVRRAVLEANAGEEADLVFSCVSAPDAEMSGVLVTRNRGTAYFFAMSTSFTKAALGAEGVGKDVDLMIGNGFAQGHAEHSLAMMGSMPEVRALFEKRYG